MTLQRRISEQTLEGERRPRHLDPEGTAEFPVPQHGAHDLVPPKNAAHWQSPPVRRPE
jgi:hypothetical protein